MLNFPLPICADDLSLPLYLGEEQPAAAWVGWLGVGRLGDQRAVASRHERACLLVVVVLAGSSMTHP